jgi:hypothetical protein
VRDPSEGLAKVGQPEKKEFVLRAYLRIELVCCDRCEAHSPRPACWGEGRVELMKVAVDGAPGLPWSAFRKVAEHTRRERGRSAIKTRSTKLRFAPANANFSSPRGGHFGHIVGSRPLGGGNVLRKCKSKLGFRILAMFSSRVTKWYPVLLSLKNPCLSHSRFSARGGSWPACPRSANK